MKTLIILGVLTALVLFYVMRGRAWLKAQPWAQGFFDFVEPYEVLLFKKSETVLFARFKMAMGVTLTVLTQIGEINLTPLMPLVPERYQGAVSVAFNLLPMVITVVGWIDEKQRRSTTMPLELVAIADKDLPPAVAEAIAEVHAAKVEAVAVRAEAKAEGAV